MKVKIFTGHESTVERRINEFLSNEEVTMVDIKFNSRVNSSEFNILVVYKEN